MTVRRLGLLTIALAMSGCGGGGGRAETPAPGTGTSASAHATLLLARRTPIPIGACCHDPKCDKKAYQEHGGACPGDPRVLGALPASAVAALLTRPSGSR